MAYRPRRRTSRAAYRAGRRYTGRRVTRRRVASRRRSYSGRSASRTNTVRVVIEQPSAQPAAPLGMTRAAPPRNARF